MNMEQEHRITYKAGITRTPSDFLCGDGELAECINLATDNEELKPIVQPTEYMRSGGGVNITRKVLYVHRHNGHERYIALNVFTFRPPQVSLSWGVRDTSGSTPYYSETDTLIDNLTDADTAILDITSVGKTLVVIDTQGIHYFLWKAQSYEPLAPIPVPDFHFWLSTDEGTDHLFAQTSGSTADMLRETNLIKDHEKYNDLIVGLYAKNKHTIAGQKGFCEPFLVRTAVELYDGSYTHISQPVMMFPSLTDNSYGVLDSSNDMMLLKTFYSQLFCTQTVNYADYKDLVKDVVVFVSSGVNLYSTDQDQPIDAISSQSSVVWKGLCGNPTKIKQESATESTPYKVLLNRSVNDINNDLESTSVFYKLCTLGTSGVTALNTASRTPDYVVKNLTTQDTLDADDYFSKCPLYPKFIYAYNSRLNIANVSRGFFEGYHNFLPYDNDSAASYDFAVTIRTEDGTERVVIHSVSNIRQKQGIYFFYPDSRATKVVIRKSGVGVILYEDLKEHPRLNGAYYFRGIQTSYTENPVTGVSWPTADTTPEQLPNYIIQSEVNNPFVFRAGGYHKVAWGEILAMTSITQALSQAQYGPFPLLVFTSAGIWNMSVDKTGIYLDSQPVGRDILLNPSSVTQTDNAVFFVSKKGLMVAEPRNSRWVEFTCVSERMDGLTFNTAMLTGVADGTDWEGMVEDCQGNGSFLGYIRSEKCFMAYDYVDSRIHIINSDYDFSYVFNIADGTISKTILPAKMTNAVNCYPDYQLQGVNGIFYSFYEKPREEEVQTRQLGFLLTRPMKLSGPTAKASLRQLMHVGIWNKGTTLNPLSCVKTEIWLSDDLQKWYSDISRFGTAAKYYRLALYIKMLPTERLSGTILTEQPRRTKNLK